MWNGHTALYGKVGRLPGINTRLSLLSPMKNNHVVIMAGGIGSRFWPLSTAEYPKQFIDVLGCGKTLIQMTYDRFKGVCPPENVWVVTNAEYVEIVRKQLPDVPVGHILPEPESRNTGPCIAWCSWKMNEINPNANVVVTPADALVTDVSGFKKVIRNSLDFTKKRDVILTIGIKPTRPETGYGYMELSDPVKGKIRSVKEFKEKPDLATAQAYLESGNYLWNAGIFVWNVDTIVESVRAFVPDLAAKMDRMSVAFYTPSEREVVGDIFPTCEKISIDYAVMEKADCIYTIPGDFGWSDVGTWGSLWTLLSHDGNGNAVVGENVHLNDCKGCIVHAPGAESVVLQGLEDSIVVERDGRLLVCRLSEEQRIKDFVK